MGILCVFCVYDTIGNRCFEKTSFPKIAYQTFLALKDRLTIIGRLLCLVAKILLLTFLTSSN